VAHRQDGREKDVGGQIVEATHLRLLQNISFS
jgi:hypothetical protein